MINSDIVSSLSKLRPNSTFLTLKGYRNEYSEIANYSIVFNVNYENALKRSIVLLNDIIPNSNLEAQAKLELITSYKKSLEKMKTTPFEELEDHYTHFVNEDGEYIKGIKYHSKTDTVHLYGFVVHKKVIIPGIYPQTNKRELTVVKDKLRKLGPVSKFRQFKLLPDHLDYIGVNSLKLLP